MFGRTFHWGGCVPQGAILLTTVLSVKSKILWSKWILGLTVHYVWVPLLLCTNPSVSMLSKWQHTINGLEKWTTENGFTISKKKTIDMHFYLDTKMHGSCFEIRQWSYPILQAYFLVFFWDIKLTFEPHIKFIKAWCQKSRVSSKSSLAQNGVLIEHFYWYHFAP